MPTHGSNIVPKVQSMRMLFCFFSSLILETPIGLMHSSRESKGLVLRIYNFFVEGSPTCGEIREDEHCPVVRWHINKICILKNAVFYGPTYKPNNLLPIS